MADPFVAEIRMFGFNFAPTGWAQCNGQLLPLSQNTALFSLLGTTYGGNGKSNFALPDLQGSTPLHPGQGQGLSLYDLGQEGGATSVTLLNQEIPFHTHFLRGSTQPGDNPNPGGNSMARFTNLYQANTTQNLQTMAFQMLSVAGGSLPHNNVMNTLVVNFCIALQGVFPARP